MGAASRDCGHLVTLAYGITHPPPLSVTNRELVEPCGLSHFTKYFYRDKVSVCRGGTLPNRL
jgi:hypothetical protein